MKHNINQAVPDSCTIVDGESVYTIGCVCMCV
jgi:hypothetical protein